MSNENGMMPYLKSLTNCLKRLMGSGYTEMFRPTPKGVESVNSSRVYGPDEIRIINSLRFEGPREPHDKATMYVIETNDGVKGMIVETDDNRQNLDLNSFIAQVRH